MVADAADVLLVDRIRSGDAEAWQDCIGRFEGRLFAFVKSRLNNSATSEDVVQETCMGFLISLPNYDDRTPLESYLFSIFIFLCSIIVFLCSILCVSIFDHCKNSKTKKKQDIIFINI